MKVTLSTQRPTNLDEMFNVSANHYSLEIEAQVLADFKKDGPTDEFIEVEYA